MLDTGNLYDLTTNPDIPEWTSQTWEIDWEHNRLLSKRIDGKKAVAQSVLVTLSTDYLKHPIFSELFGSELYTYIGKDKDLLKCNAKRLIGEAIAPDLRILKMRDFEIKDIDKNTVHFIFKIECEDGLEEILWEVLLE